MREKFLNVYVFIGNITQPQEKRNHLFILQKSMLCNTPPLHPPAKARSSLKKTDPWCENRVSPWKAGSVIYFPIIYGFSPFPSSLKSKHC